MKIGYARVSTLDQNPDMQRDELEKAGCEKVFVDQVRAPWPAVRLKESLSPLPESRRSQDAPTGYLDG